MKDGIFIDDFVTKQLKLGNFSTRGLHLTCHAMKFTVSYTDHIFGKSDNVHDDKALVSPVTIFISTADFMMCRILLFNIGYNLL